MLEETLIETPEEDMAKAPTLEELSGKQLIKMIADAQELLQARKQEAILGLRTKILEMCEDEGVALTDVFPPAQPPQRAKKVNGEATPGPKAAIKYRFPDGSTWAGRGRPPQHVKDFAGADGVNGKGFLSNTGKETLTKYLGE